MIASPVMVAGGGLAGAAAAAGLARAGMDVTLIEREARPVDKICGEFLSTEAQPIWGSLGLDVGVLRGAPISRVRLVRGNQAVTTKLPFQGLGLSRFTLDEALLQHAASSGANILRGRSVRNVAAEQKISLAVEGIGIVQPQICCWRPASMSCAAPNASFPLRMI